MDIYDKIDDIYKYLISIEGQEDKKKKIKVYSEGVKTKLLNAEYSFKKIKELDSETEYYGDTTAEVTFTIDDKIQFYVESFFAFLYSVFDVVSHVINQKYTFFNDERKVKFKRTIEELERINSNNPLTISLKRISRLRYFKALDDYRNCATHRRDIFIGKRGTSPSRAYVDYTQDLEIPKRVLADNPLEIIPSTREDKFLVEYSEDMLKKTSRDILLIFKRIREIY